jgi:hypothetical protein
MFVKVGGKLINLDLVCEVDLDLKISKWLNSWEGSKEVSVVRVTYMAPDGADGMLACTDFWGEEGEALRRFFAGIMPDGAWIIDVMKRDAADEGG